MGPGDCVSTSRPIPSYQASRGRRRRCSHCSPASSCPIPGTDSSCPRVQVLRIGIAHRRLTHRIPWFDHLSQSTQHIIGKRRRLSIGIRRGQQPLPIPTTGLRAVIVIAHRLILRIDRLSSGACQSHHRSHTHCIVADPLVQPWCPSASVAVIGLPELS